MVYLHTLLAIWVPKSFCAKTVGCYLSLEHLWTKAYPCPCWVLPLYQGYARQCFRQEKRLCFDLCEQGLLQFSLIEESSLTFNSFTWAPLARAFPGYLLPLCSWKEATFYTWELFCISSTFTHGRNPAGIATLYELLCRSCSSLFKSNAYLKG